MIGKRIKKARKKLGLTQEELANRAQISRSSVANYESGLREPKGTILVNIATALNTTTDFLLGHGDTQEAADKDIETAIGNDPALMELLSEIKNREDLKSLLKQAKPMTSDEIKKVIRIIKALNDETKEG